MSPYVGLPPSKKGLILGRLRPISRLIVKVTLIYMIQLQMVFLVTTLGIYCYMYSETLLWGPWDHENYLVISGFSLYQGK